MSDDIIMLSGKKKNRQMSDKLTGSNRIFALMKKGYIAGEYFKKLMICMRMNPGSNLTSTIRVGCPGGR